MKILCVIILCVAMGCVSNKDSVKDVEKENKRGFSYYFWSIYPWL
jgi:hypothetical protein